MLQLGRLEEAIARATTAVADLRGWNLRGEVANDCRPYWVRARAYERSGKLDLAVADYESERGSPAHTDKQEATRRDAEKALAKLAGKVGADAPASPSATKAGRQPTPRAVTVVPNVGHTTISSVAFSPMDDLLLTGGWDNAAKLWDRATGRLIRTFRGPSQYVSGVGFAKNKILSIEGLTLSMWESLTGDRIRVFKDPPFSVGGRIIISADGARVISSERYGGAARIWDVPMGTLVRTIVVPGNGHLSISDDATRVITVDYHNVGTVWNGRTGKSLRTITFSGEKILTISLSPDGRYLATGDRLGEVRLWSLEDGALVGSFRGHKTDIEWVGFSPDGRRVLSIAKGGIIKLWDAATGKEFIGAVWESTGVQLVRFSPDGRQILTRSPDHILRLWDVDSGRLLQRFQRPEAAPWSEAFSSDGRLLAAGYVDGTLAMWDTATGKLIHDIPGQFASGASVFFAPEEDRLIVSNKSIVVWELSSGRVSGAFGGRQTGDPFALSKDGQYLAEASAGGTIAVRSTRRGNLIRGFKGDAPVRLAMSDDGRLLAVVEKTNALTVWDTASGKTVARVPWSENEKRLSLARTGARLLTMNWNDKETTSKLWDLANGRELSVMPGESLFSPDGKYVLSRVPNGPARLIEADTGKAVATLEGTGNVTAAAFADDSRTVVTGGSSGLVQRWHVPSGNLLASLVGHSEYVSPIAVSPDGRLIASGSGGAVIVWDAATGRVIHTLTAHPESVRSLAFSPDGRRMASSGSDASVKIWDVGSGTLVTSLFGSSADEWIALTPEGFFSGRTGTSKLLSIVRGLDVFDIDQLYQSLYNSDLVGAKLAGDSAGEVKASEQALNLEKVIDSGPAPVVALTSPAEGSQTATDLVTVTSRIDDGGKGVGRIEWRVNGITAAVASKPAGGGPVYTVTKELALDPGDNTIDLVAYNSSNLLASRPARTTVKFTGPADKTRPTLHILAIGINKYNDKGWGPPGGDAIGFGPLGLAVKDATAFAYAMRKAGGSLYDDVRVTLALDQDATRDNLHKLVDKVAAQIHPRDTFILFAAAHGFSEHGRFYLIPQDYQHGPPGTLARRAIGQDDLQDWLANRIKAKRALVLLDTCESGALVAGHSRSRTDLPASEAGIGRLHEATGRPVLTAAAAGQFAYEGLISATGQRHGVFTWAVLDALHKGDTSGNGTIELSELVAHVQRSVPEAAAAVRGRGLAVVSVPERSKQSARFGSRGEDFVVALRLQ